MHAAHIIAIDKVEMDDVKKEEEEKKNQIESSGDKKVASEELEQAKNIANGKLVLMKSNFLKLAVPLWAQYDEENTLQLDKEDFYMVAQDTVTEYSQTQSLKQYQNDLFQTVFEDSFDETFANYDTDNKGHMQQRSFYQFFDDLVQKYNTALDDYQAQRKEQRKAKKGNKEEKSNSNEDLDDELGSEEREGSSANLMKQLEKKDTHLEGLKQNTD